MEYSEYIRFEDDMLRPVIKEVGIPVHKIVKQYREGKTPQEIVQNYYDVHHFLDRVADGREKSEINVDYSVENTDVERGEISVPVLTNEHVEAALAFAEENSEMMTQIIEEHDALMEAMLNDNPHKAADDVNSISCQYFNVNAKKSKDGDELVVSYEYEQD